MANIKFGPLVADVRGSVGGTCFSRTAGGAIVRNAPKPCNPRSAPQMARRATLAYLAAYWSRTLTEPFRGAWTDYALGTTWTNRVGGPAIITGLAAFIRLNSLELLIGNPIRANAPTALGHAGTPSFTITANPTACMLGIALPSAPYVNTANDWYMTFFEHGPTNVGRTLPGGQRIYLGFVASASGTPPSWPKSIAANLNFFTGQRTYVTGILIDSDYRVGGDYTASVVAAVP